MKFLFHFTDKDVAERLIFALEAKYQVKVSLEPELASVLKALEREEANQSALRVLQGNRSSKNKAAVAVLEKSKELNFLILPYNGTDISIFKFIAESALDIPILVITDKSLKDKIFSSINLVGVVREERIVEDAPEIIEEWTKLKSQPIDERLDRNYCPIRTSLLLTTTPILADIFLRCSDGSYIKVYTEGDELKDDTVRRLELEKKVEYLYINNDDQNVFLKKFQADLAKLVNDENVEVATVRDVATQSQDMISEMISRSGFTEEVQAVAKQAINLTVKNLSKNATLATILKNLKMNDDKYISAHSFLLSNIACCIASIRSWESRETMNKLCMAAFFHDITLKNQELAEVQTLKELEEGSSRFTEEEIKEYRNHPINAAEIVRKFKEIPPDVDTIIIQHHEGATGEGFPRKLSHSYISQLSSLFIIAHDIVTHIHRRKNQFDLRDFVRENKEKYAMGNFKKVMADIEKSVDKLIGDV